MKPADIAYWLNVKEWTLMELFFLLRMQEPELLETLSEAEQQTLREDLATWRTWGRFCPEVPANELCPFETKYPADGLLRWAETLHGIEVPEAWHPLYKTELNSDKLTSEQSIGKREQENLLITIGALSLALADSSYPVTGSADKPNYKGIASVCARYVDAISGMSENTLRQRISKGIKTLREK